MSAISTLDDYIDDFIDGAADFVDAKKHRSMSRWAHNINEEVLDAQDDSDFQGEISIKDIVANQREYIIPSDLLKPKRIDLKIDGDNWKPTNWMDESEVGRFSIADESDIIQNFDSVHPFVSLFDKSFFIFSGTLINVTGGIKIWYHKEIVGEDTNGDDIIAFTADTDTPNLQEFSQMALVYGAVLDYATDTNNASLKADMNLRLYGNKAGRPANANQMGGLIGQIRRYYSSRNEDRQMALGSSYSEQDFR